MHDSTLSAFVPSAVALWLRDHPELRWREVEGSVVLADISGFTALTERLASRGREGAEEMSDILNGVFSELLAVAAQEGAHLLKWGGDAVLLLVEGAEHEIRAARVAALLMRRITEIGKVGPSRARVTLSMSIGVHSGVVTLMLVGDPELHRELLVVGGTASQVVRLQSAAQVDQIAVSDDTARALPPDVVGDSITEGRLLVGCPPSVADGQEVTIASWDVSVAVPARIRRHVLESSSHSEHRRITVAFVRYSGVDELIAQQGVHVAAGILEDFVRAVQSTCERHGVTFLESDSDDSGGKILLTAGAPVSSGDDEERLLLVCHDIVEFETPLRLQVGVNHGPVFSGDFGPAHQRTYSVKGDAVNVAARLAAKAGDREILSTPGVVERSQAQFDVTSVAPLILKGKRDPLEALAVGRRMRVATSHVTGELLGRGDERELLRAEGQRALSQGGRTVVIEGAPGIGKTRMLTSTLSEWIGRVISVSGDAYATTTPYAIARRILRNALGLDDDSSLADVESAMRDAAMRCDPGLVAWLPLIATVAGIDMSPTDQVAALAEEFRKEKAHSVTVQLLEHLLTEPTLIAIDNAHLVDASSAELLSSLAVGAHRQPWLFIALRREVADGLTLEGARIIALKPLTDDVVRAVVRRELPNRPPSDVTTIVTRSGGNPLFLFGLIDAARAGESIDSLPESVEALVTAQLDRLPSAQRTLVRVTSVLGMSFRLGEVGSLTRLVPGAAHESDLRSLPMIVSTDVEGVYRFEHQLVRDTAYEGLPRRLRRSLHADVADQLEVQVVDAVEVAGLLSLHCAAAGRRASTWRYSRMAAGAAAASGAFAEAEQLLLRATEAARGLRDVTVRERSQVRLELGEAQRRVGRAEAALASFRLARALVRDDDDAQAAVLVREASVQRRLGRYTSAWRTARRGLTMLHGARATSSLSTRSRLAMVCSGVRAHQGRYREALEWARTAEGAADAAGDREAGADAAAMIYLSLLMLGTPDRRYGEQALALYEQVGDRLRQSEALNNLAMLSWNEGHAEQALCEFESAHLLAQQAGDAFQAAATEANVGDILMRVERFGEAIEVLNRVLPELVALGAASYEAVALRSLALALAHSGSADEAGTHIERARAIQEKLNEHDELPETRAAAELIAQMRGNH